MQIVHAGHMQHLLPGVDRVEDDPVPHHHIVPIAPQFVERVQVEPGPLVPVAVHGHTHGIFLQ